MTLLDHAARWASVMAALGAAGVILAGFLAPLDPRFDFYAHFRGHAALLALGASAAFAALAWRGAGLRRRRAGAAALICVLVAGLALAHLGPVWRAPSDALASTASDARRVGFRVATANMLYSNPEPDAVVAALLAIDADILATQETYAEFWAAADALRARYPHHAALRRRGGYYGATLWSKAPLTRRVAGVGGRDAPMHAFGVVRIAGCDVTVASLHFAWPLPWPLRSAQPAQARSVARLVGDRPAPRVAMGDFNAAPWSWTVNRVGAALDAAPIGGLRRTWWGYYPTPIAGLELPAPLGAQIDHILISPEIAVRAVGVAEIPGSDHLAVIADLAIAPCAP